MADDARHWLGGLEAAGITLGLERIRALLDELGHPEHTFTTTTIAGTNGKGSVTAMVERGIRASGRRTGRYISPHLIHIEERVALDGATIDAQSFDLATNAVREACERVGMRPSFFEATTAIALVAFREAAVDVAVLEVGLGGRLDATNAADAALAVITNIGLDHEAFLGNTIEAIATEKAGVIKSGAMVVAGRMVDAARSVISGTAARMTASCLYAPDGVTIRADVDARGSQIALRTPTDDYGVLRLALPGRHQIDNAVTAVRTLEAARDRGLAPIDAAAVQTALGDVNWPGRLDWRQWQGRDVLIDGAHNPDGARALAAFLQETTDVPVPIVVGLMRDKAIGEVLTALTPVASVFVCVAASTARAASSEELANIAARVSPEVPRRTAAAPSDALSIAAEYGSPIVVGGSLHLAGDVLALIA